MSANWLKEKYIKAKPLKKGTCKGCVFDTFNRDMATIFAVAYPVIHIYTKGNQLKMLDYDLPIPDKPTHHIIDSSKLNCYMECPRKFFYEYMLGWRSERPNNHLVFGTAWHEAMEYLLLNDYSHNSILAAFAAFEKNYRQTLSDPENDEVFWPKTPDRAFECLAEYATRYHDDLSKFEVLFTEIAFTVQMDETRFLYGRMDSVLRRKADNLICSLEHKTGSSLKRWAEQFHMCMQGGTYSHALMCLYGFDRVGPIIFNGSIFKKTKGTRGATKFDFHREPVKKSKAQMQVWHTNTLYWMDQLEREYQLLEQSSANDDVMIAFPLNTTNCTKWFGCQNKDFCNSWKNPLAKCFQPPLGMIEDHWDPTAEDANFNMQLQLGSEPVIEKGTKNVD